MGSDERAIRELHSTWIDAVNAGDLVRLLTVISRADGEATQLAGHRITVYRKQRDGRWLLARDAHTLSPMEK